MRHAAGALLGVLGCAARAPAPIATPELARVAYAEAVWAESVGDPAAAAERRALAARVAGADPATRRALAVSSPLFPDDGVSPASRAACEAGLEAAEAAGRAADGHLALPTPASLGLWAALAHDAGDVAPVVAWAEAHDAAAWGPSWASAVAGARGLAEAARGGAGMAQGAAACAALTGSAAGR